MARRQLFELHTRGSFLLHYCMDFLLIKGALSGQLVVGRGQAQYIVDYTTSNVMEGLQFWAAMFNAVYFMSGQY